jgi:hypothetical protein
MGTPHPRSGRPRGRVLTVAGVALILTGALVGANGWATAADPPPPALDEPAVAPDPQPKTPMGSPDMASPEYAMPASEATPDQTATAVSIAQNDPNVKAMLGSRPYTVSDTSSWDADAQTTIGSIVTLSFDTPQDLTGTWTVVTTAPGSSPPYTLSPESYTTVYGASDIDVWVDLSAGTAVGIMPEGDVTTN